MPNDFSSTSYSALSPGSLPLSTPALAASYAELLERFGSPLFVYDADVISARYRQLRGGLPADVDIYYSLKANPNVSVCAHLGRLGAGAEVSSLTELRTALWAGIPHHKIIFLGPGKSEAELTACVEWNVGAVIVESLDELFDLDRIARERGVDHVDALIRINPDFAAKSSGLTMGGKPRQFGIDVSAVLAAAVLLKSLEKVRVRGLHAYLGTRFLDYREIVRNTENILKTAETLKQALDIPLDTVDFGGGFGIAYFDNETDLDVDSLLPELAALIDAFVAANPGSRLITEQGRFLTAESGSYLVKVRYIKESMGEKFAIADGGTNHHMAAVGIGSFVKRNYPIVSFTDGSSGAEEHATVTGPLCTPNDVIGKRVLLPKIRRGDVLGIRRSGAYGLTASPGLFLGHGFPAEVLILDGTPHLIRRRDTVDDLLSHQVLAQPFTA
ncbi:type III PLP-dependent enzyme [Telmatospirillum siberiense]|uniref:Diaminopimelate decarboxylase n=1 Tax=Telmatospirillum siberiense TaxID=382514 RepID=A0A2N3PNV8_9PROT|nr:type III PLP-dependent enzyme [Telmatospirillum siberiense]PKU22086.1 diaminopimelate decarboxylase [Telmatospirillum siberiense]